ncbi:hypothetical protein MLD38_025414 [Melastoma candidum]|uniref:Uncharacterized protein n=1 Tax=Melastoma candidum TaxID=119954 RepID=A0ACB9P283_9MYRT|nr:hypothetical protein MLD38_025414 [Melastoma candidum]
MFSVEEIAASHISHVASAKDVLQSDEWKLYTEGNSLVGATHIFGIIMGEGSTSQSPRQEAAGQARRGRRGAGRGKAGRQSARDTGRRNAESRAAEDGRSEEPQQNPNVTQTEEEREPEYERFAQYWSDKLAEEVAMQDPDKSVNSDSSVEEFDHEYFARFREKQKQVQEEAMESSPIISSESESSDSDMEVIDSNTYCTLYKNGNYIAPKEEGLLPGVVEMIGVRYKLEWRHTYALVWVRRKPEWVCFPKLDYYEGCKEEAASSSKDLVLKPPSLKRKIGDWFVQRANKRRRVEKAERRARSRRCVAVADKGVQTDYQLLEDEVNVEESVGRGTMTDEGVQTDNKSPEEGTNAQEVGTELGDEDVYIVAREKEGVVQLSAELPNPDPRSLEQIDHDGGIEEGTLADKGVQDDVREEMVNEGVIILGWNEGDQVQEEAVEPCIEGKKEEEAAQVPDCQASPGRASCSENGSEETVEEGYDAEGWAFKYPVTLDCGTQTDAYLEQVAASDESINLKELVTRVVDGFEDLDEEMKLIQCQAMKFIMKNVRTLSTEFSNLLDLMTTHVREGVHKKFTSLYGTGHGEPSKESDRFDREAMVRFKQQIEQDASLHKLEERMLGLMWQIEIYESAPPGTVREYAIPHRRADLLRMLNDWKAVVNSKKESRVAQLKEWDVAVERMTKKVNRPPLTETQIGDINASLHQFFEEHYGRLRASNPPRTLPTVVPTIASVAIPDVAPETMPEVAQDAVIDIAPNAVPDAAPDAVPDSVPDPPNVVPDAAPDAVPESVPYVEALTVQNAISLLYVAVTDPMNRPPALDQRTISEAMEQLRAIQGESNRAARVQKCRVLRDYLEGLEGVPTYIGDLHVELLLLAEEAA